MTRDVLNTIPTENDKIDFKSICKALTLLRQSRKVLASPYSLKDEVDGIIGLITKLSEGRPPRDQDLALLSPLAKMMLKRCEDAYNIMVPNADKSVKNPFGALQKLSGAEAIQHTFEMTKANMNSRASTMTLEDLKPLNQFRWVLTPTQRTQLWEWHRIIASAVCVAGGAKKALLGKGYDKELSLVSTGASSSSRSSGSKGSSDLLAQDGAIPTKKTVIETEKRRSDRADILLFFKSQSRRVTE